MKMIKSAIAFSTLLLAACGGGGGSSEPTSVVSVASYSASDVDEANVENAALQVTSFLRAANSVWGKTRTIQSEFMLDTDYSLPFGPYQQTVLCERRGSFDIQQDVKSRKVNANKFPALRAGDFLTFNYKICEFDSYPVGMYIHGRMTHTVSAGIFANAAYQTGTELTTESSNLHVKYNGNVSYQSGKYKVTYANSNSLTVTGSNWAYRNDFVKEGADYRMRTFNLMYGGSGSPLSTPTVLKAGSTFVLGGNVTGFEHTVQVETDVNIDAGDATYPNSGQLLLTGNASRARITYHAGYLNYELDSDNDGSFETSSIINSTSY